jgi:hypothetical protein
LNKIVTWRCAGKGKCYFVFVFVFGLVRMYHTTSTINHVRAELMNPTVTH